MVNVFKYFELGAGMLLEKLFRLDADAKEEETGADGELRLPLLLSFRFSTLKTLLLNSAGLLAVITLDEVLEKLAPGLLLVTLIALLLSV